MFDIKFCLPAKLNYKIEEFRINGDIPFSNMLFFMQHFVPYVFFMQHCIDKDVLEIGTGQGYGTYYLSKVARAVTGIDIRPNSVEPIQAYRDAHSAKNINFVCANGIYLPFADKTFDRIITCQVIEHIPEDNLVCFLEELSRVLKDDGCLFISTLNIEHNIKNKKTYEKFIEHYKEFTASELKLLLSKVFPKLRLCGLNITFKHRFFLRLKRWGILKYNLFGINPVRRFFNTVSPRDFKISNNISRKSSDLFALCFKK